MQNTERCPQCHMVPDVKIESPLNVILSCERHGHVAMGDTLEAAKKHWNIYIAFVRKELGHAA